MEEQHHERGLNLSGLDLNNIDIDQFVNNNRDFLDCSLEAIFKYNIKNINDMAPYIDFGSYKRVDLIKNSVKQMLTMAYEAAEVQRLPDTYIQYLVEQINDYLSNTSFTGGVQFLNRRSFLSLHVKLANLPSTLSPYAAMYSSLSSFSTSSSPSSLSSSLSSISSPIVQPPSSSSSSSSSSLASLSPPTTASPVNPRSLFVRKNSVVGVEVVNLTLKKSPARTRRVVEMEGIEEITTLEKNDSINNNNNAMKVEEITRSRPFLHIRETEEVNLSLKKEMIGMAGGAFRGKPKLAVIEEEEGIEEVNLSVKSNNNGDESKKNMIEELHSEAEEVVTFSLSNSLQLENEGKDWIVENANKYGPVLIVQAAEPMAMKVKLQSYKSEEWDNDEDVTEEFFAKFEVLRRVYGFESMTSTNQTERLPHTVNYAFENGDKGINFVLIYHDRASKELVCCTLLPIVVV